MVEYIPTWGSHWGRHFPGVVAEEILRGKGAEDWPSAHVHDEYEDDADVLQVKRVV